MSHDLRNAVGYRHIPAQDKQEQRLRDDLFYARGRLVEDPEDPVRIRAVESCDKRLADYLWQRSCSIVAADRAKHPKAKRNAPVGSMPAGKAGAIEVPDIPGLTQPDPRGIAK